MKAVVGAELRRRESHKSLSQGRGSKPSSQTPEAAEAAAAAATSSAGQLQPQGSPDSSVPPQATSVATTTAAAAHEASSSQPLEAAGVSSDAGSKGDDCLGTEQPGADFGAEDNGDTPDEPASPGVQPLRRSPRKAASATTPAKGRGSSASVHAVRESPRKGKGAGAKDGDGARAGRTTPHKQGREAGGSCSSAVSVGGETSDGSEPTNGDGGQRGDNGDGPMETGGEAVDGAGSGDAAPMKTPSRSTSASAGSSSAGTKATPQATPGRQGSLSLAGAFQSTRKPAKQRSTPTANAPSAPAATTPVTNTPLVCSLWCFALQSVRSEMLTCFETKMGARLSVVQLPDRTLILVPTPAVGF
jgi:hypothetical protein